MSTAPTTPIARLKTSIAGGDTGIRLYTGMNADVAAVIESHELLLQAAKYALTTLKSAGIQKDCRDELTFAIGLAKGKERT